MIFDPLFFVMLLPFMLLGMVAQAWTMGAYRRWSAVANARRLTGAEVASAMLRAEGLSGIAPGRAGADSLGGVRIEATHGALSDHYDPRARVIRLSEGVYSGRSIAAAAIAAHETGHAIQHATGYAPLALRSVAVPVGVRAPQIAMLLAFLGFMTMRMGTHGFFFYLAGLVYAAAVILAVVSLPVEFNASGRAMRALAGEGLLLEPELSGARTVLAAAASTYVVAALMSIVHMLYYFLAAQRR